MWFGAGLIKARAFRTNKKCGALSSSHSEKAESDKHAFSPACANHIAMVARYFSLFAGSIGTLAILAGCDAPVSTPPVVQDERQSSSPVVARDDLKQRQADFLNRIREADPQHRTIDRAMLNEQNELGLILDGSVEMDKVPELMRTILGQMAREFPGQDLTVLAYTPSNPPHKIGTAKLNAQTRDMSYTPAQ